MSNLEIKTENKSIHCLHYVTRKKRFCRMTLRPGKNYCGEHDPTPQNEKSDDVEQLDPRVPCPLDPKHTCYLSKLQKHLKICNARCDIIPAYLDKGINSSFDSAEEPRIPLKDIPYEDLKRVILKVDAVFKNLVESCITTLPDYPIHQVVENEFSNAQRGHATKRHLKQTSSLLSLMEDEGLVAENTCYIELGAGKGHLSYYMSRAVSGVPGSSVLLIDRASHRHKQDNKLDKDFHEVLRVRADIRDLVLAKIDLVEKSTGVVAVTKHLCGVATDYALRCVTTQGMEKKCKGIIMATCCHHRCTANGYVAAYFIEDIGMDKHDFGILLGIVSWATCGTGYSRDRKTEDTFIDKNEGSINKRAKIEETHNKEEAISNDNKLNSNYEGDTTFNCMVTQKVSSIDCDGKVNNCLSETKDNCNKEHVSQDCTNISSTADIEKKIEQKESFAFGLKNIKGLGLSFRERTEIGRRAKAILDYGRIQFLNSNGFHAKLCHYVDVSVSPENICIVATKT